MGNCLGQIIRIIAMGDWLSQREREESTEGASTSSSISPEATGAGSGQHDVFLSFSGFDTRKEFTDHLYHSLELEGIRVFKDDRSIPIGEEFSSQIFDAITQSKISIPIISKNYASSKWCLRELIHIMDCKKRSSQIVLPIFYKVTPSDVRHLAGNFGDTFRFRLRQGRFDEKIIQEGPEALREVSDLHGWESTKVANGYEGKLIQVVVKEVSSKLKKDFQLDIPRQLVGLDGCLRKIMNWIHNSPSVNARMIGIYGMGGIGKTTLAKCIYNELLVEFEHASFLPNVREKAAHHGGIEDLQRQLISDILGSDNKVSKIDDGINIIKSRFKGKKVLILLDDIDDQKQLDNLARERDWFIAGSIIIVTTRNEAVLVQSKFKVDHKYEMEGLDQVESLRLFNRHAFRIDYSPQDFESISSDIVSLMGGLPLALEVVGSYLYEKTNRKVWEDVRKQLQSQPHEDVEKKLRISYDALKDGHKQIFVDIACFFIGEDFNKWGQDMMFMWEGCGFYPNQGIEELKLRCLIKIKGDNGKLEMHDQLRDLGRSIFCQGQPPEKCSGPWDDNYEGVPSVLRRVGDPWRVDCLMRAALRGEKDLSEVRWLDWWDYDGLIAPLWTANLRLSKLVVLALSGSDRITEDWEGWSWLGRASPRLTALTLNNSDFLRSTPDLSAFTQLKFLNLSYCFLLKHLHPSIGKLKSLVSLDLRKCIRLEELPEEVGKLKDLEELYLSETGIRRIPTSIGSLGKLKKLDASFCFSLRGIPSSIGSLKSLQTLNLNDTPIFDLSESIWYLSNLQRRHLWGCDEHRSVPKLPSSLADLKVSRAILRLPHLCSLIHLERLLLVGCHLLEDITDLPSRLWKLNGLRYLEELSIIDCSSIEILDLSELVRLKRLEAWHCNNLVKIRGLDNLEILEDISIAYCNSIKNLLYPKSECLKYIRVCRCDNLVEIQGPVHGAMFLEELRIANCKSLETLPDLTGCEKLRHPIIRGCKKLTQIRGYRWDSTTDESCSDDGDESYSNNESCSDDGDES